MSTIAPLTDEQIDTLFAFVKSRYVDFYDLQVELVDHLASEVEQRMAAMPGVTFDTALQQVYRGFGIFGFSDFVGEKHKAVDKRARVLWWQFVKEFFRFPLILASLFGGVFTFSAFDFFEPELFVEANAILSLSAVVITGIYFFRNMPRKGVKLTALQYTAMLHFWAMTHFQIVWFFSKWMIEGYTYEQYSILIPLLCWLSWIGFVANTLGYRKLIEESRKQFPLAFA